MFFASEKLIKLLKNVRSYFIYNRSKDKDIFYCIAEDLSEEAKSIYRAFDKAYLLTPQIMKD